jgi:hypothetical protein
MEYEFDEKHGLSWGYYFCQNCKNEFYVKSSPKHKSDCELRFNGYENIVYVFGPKEVKIVKKQGNSQYSDLSLKVLKDEFPELLDC